MTKKLFVLSALMLATTLGVARADDADQGYAAAMKKMQANMKSPAGDADKDFADLMIPHHQAAAEMAKVELQYGKDPVLRKMATEIVRTQEQEIADFKTWQAKTIK